MVRLSDTAPDKRLEKRMIVRVTASQNQSPYATNETSAQFPVEFTAIEVTRRHALDAVHPPGA